MTKNNQAQKQEEQLEGSLGRFLFINEDRDFAIAIIHLDGGGEIKVVGGLVGLQPGERVRLLGHSTINPQYGPQFKVSAAYPLLPYTSEGVRAYLAQGRIKGIGAGLARRLVKRFGAETLKVIQESPERLADVPGIGPKRCQEIREVILEQNAHQEALIYLQGQGMSANMAQRIWRKYNSGSIAFVRENPYRLADEMRGVGFLRADRIAQAMGFGLDHPIRAAASLSYILGQAAGEGHVYLPRELLLERAAELLDNQDLAEQALESSLQEGSLRAEGEAIWLPALQEIEQELAQRLLIRCAQPSIALPVDTEFLAEELGLELAAEQERALRAAAHSGLLLITGGPGTGKTTIVRALIKLFEGKKISLAAPTGRAARRLSEATGREARTLHRLLEYLPGKLGFRRNSENPLDVEVLIVDEVSMVDQGLFLALLRALPLEARLILVGDAHQLPSVGPGQVLADLLSGGVINAVYLMHIFRQAQASRIVVNAHRVLGSQLPELPEQGISSDFYRIRVKDPEEASEVILRLVSKRIPEAFGFDPIQDIQVLAPMHKGACGTERLNLCLQEMLNPHGRVVEGGAFRVGDKVMQIRNDYEKEVFNGDLGRVVQLEGKKLILEFEGRLVSYTPSAQSDLVLAYACSVHKSQGSEYPAVVIPVLTEHWLMLQRNLLYTALTRGRSLVVLVGQNRALSRAVRNTEGLSRFTSLARRLQQA